MNLGEYRLLFQVGAGSDGPAYRAEPPGGGEALEVRVLSGARADGRRWEALGHRLRMLSIAEHPALIEIRELALRHDPPFLALEWVDAPSLAEALVGRLPMPRVKALTLAKALADALAAAHRLGLAHERIGPEAVFGGIDKHPPLLDFTGIDVGPRVLDDRPGLEAIEILDAPFRAPEQAGSAGARPGPKADIYGLGVLLGWLLTGRPDRQAATLPDTSTLVDDSPMSLATTIPDADPALDQLLREMLRQDPDIRPSAREVSERIGMLLAEDEDHRSLPTIETPSPIGVPAGPASAPPAPAPDVGGRLGRFRLLEKLGQGGMGAVFRAEDLAEGTVVAVKVLRPEFAGRPDSLRRFLKEARLLSEVNNPYVTNFVEVNEDGGVHFLALEYVKGESLAARLAKVGRLGETVAVAIMADVARGLAAAHERGIVHRDIKPDNILLVDPGPAPGTGADETVDLTLSTGELPTIKLSDFGVARHIVETESLALTRDHAVIGTPAYMAPEQGAGAPVDPRTDVYAMGATLFHLLAGKAPFVGDNLMDIIAKHRAEPPPPLRSIVPGLGEGTCQVVAKALAKAPDDRYPDASAMLADLQRILRGEPTRISTHPKLPDCDPARVLQFDFRWELDSSPRALWPHVTSTDRLNRAVGLPSVRFDDRREAESGDGAGGRFRRFGSTRWSGLPVAWEEHPFEWVEPRRFGVLRTFRRGPMKWVVSLVELSPRPGGGTTLTHRVRLEPSMSLLRPVVKRQVGGGMRRSLERVYRRIDAAISGRLGSGASADPFEEPNRLPASRKRRLESGLDRIVTAGVDAAVAEALGDFLAHAPDQEVARLRPLALARRMGLDPDEVARACLLATREGLLVLMWDLLCPVCRIPSEVKETLRALKEHGRCEACDLDYELDFANSVELVFRAHPEIREVETATYCVGGPAHSPHVVAQVRIAPGERIELELALPEGAYVLRGPQLSYSIEFLVEPRAPARRWDLDLSQPPPATLPRALLPGLQTLALANAHDQELVARVERTAPRSDALTAARASSLALFRELFPEEVLAPGQLASIRNLTLLVTDLAGADALYEKVGDSRAFGTIHAALLLQDDCIRRAGGAVVKTVGEGLLAAFEDPAAAVRAALELLGRGGTAVDKGNGHPERHDRGGGGKGAGVGFGGDDLIPRIGIHRGAALVATLNDHLDYFGAVVNVAVQLPRLARAGELALSPQVAADPRVAALLGPLGIGPEVVPARLPGLAEGFFHRVAAPRDSDGAMARAMAETMETI